MSAAHDELDAETANAVRVRCADRVRKIVVEVLNIHASDRRQTLPNSASLHIEWSADSLDLIDITMSIEDEFDISIPDAEAARIDSIDAIVDRVLQGRAS